MPRVPQVPLLDLAKQLNLLQAQLVLGPMRPMGEMSAGFLRAFIDALEGHANRFANMPAIDVGGGHKDVAEDSDGRRFAAQVIIQELAGMLTL